MAVYYLSISAGNLFTSGVNFFIRNADGSSKLPGASYYWFFTANMAAAALIFIFVAKRYQVRNYTQDSPDAA
jgi:POT family proton-dependent oligopeptide transporter